LLRVSLDEAFDESGLSDTRRADDGYDDGRGFFW
jgi:hypothetical protein